MRLESLVISHPSLRHLLTLLYLAAVKAVGAFGAPSGFVPTARWFRRPAQLFGAVCWMRLLDVCVPGSFGVGPFRARLFPISRVFFRLVQCHLVV